MQETHENKSKPFETCSSNAFKWVTETLSDMWVNSAYIHPMQHEALTEMVASTDMTES